MTKNMIFGSMAAAGIVALLAILDLVLKVPFAGRMVTDILFLVAAGMVLYMGWDTYRENR
ncbi:MAG: hypothetical protein ACKV0T_29750 [Planctomycetales bacterium]